MENGEQRAYRKNPHSFGVVVADIFISSNFLLEGYIVE